MTATARDYEPGPVKRAMLIKAAVKLVGRCPGCEVLRPLEPSTGRCWPCNHLASDTYPLAATARQRCPKGQSCDDCAFRAESPEGEALPLDKQLGLLHVSMPGSDGHPQTTRDVVMLQALNGTAIFWCHKPFLEPIQQWGWDSSKKEMIPLYGPHWKPCAAWAKIFDKKFGVQKP